MGLIISRGYNVLDIANWFHSLPHLDHSFKPISNAFDPLNESYLFSLSLFVCLPIAIMLIVLSLYIIFTICMCCCLGFCCTPEEEPKTDIRIECKVFIFLFGLVCGLSFISGIYGVWHIYNGVNEVEDSFRDATKWIKHILSLSNQIYDLLKVEQILTTLKTDINELKEIASSEEIKQLNKFVGYSDQILGYLSSADQQIKDSNKTINDSNYEEIPNFIEYYGTIFCITVVQILLVLAIIGFVFTFAIFSRLMLICFTVLAVISFMLSCVLMGQTFVASVGGSDFCLGVKPWIRSKVPNEHINDYLIDCVSDNIVHKYLNDSDQYVIKAKQMYHELDTGLRSTLDKICNNNTNNTEQGIEQAIEQGIEQGIEYGIEQDIEQCQQGMADKFDNKLKEIRSKTDQLLALVNAILKEAKCDRINKDLNQTLDTICTDILKGIIIIFFNSIVASFCFAIIIFSVTIALS